MLNADEDEQTVLDLIIQKIQEENTNTIKEVTNNETIV